MLLTEKSPEMFLEHKGYFCSVNKQDRDRERLLSVVASLVNFLGFFKDFLANF